MMRSNRVMVFWGVLCFWVAFSSALIPTTTVASLPDKALAQTGNLLENGGFEEGLKGWRPLSYYTANDTGGWDAHAFEHYRLVKGQALEGETHLKLQPPERMTVTLNPEKGFTVFAGCAYTFKINFRRALQRVDIARTTPALRVIFRDEQGKQVAFQGGRYYVYSNTKNKEASVSQWTAEAYTFTLDPDSPVARVDLTVYFYAAGTIELDGIGFFNDTVRENSLPTEATTSFVPVALDEARMGLPETRIPQVSTAPVLDGRANDALWGRSQNNLLVNAHTGAASAESTTVKACYDTNYLYLFFRAVERGQESHSHGTVARDDEQIYVHDAVEVFLQCPGQSPGYYQITVNPRGGVYDRKWLTVGQDLPWDGAGIKAVGVIGFDDWSLELKIPFRALGRDTPSPGELWRVNFCRTERPGQRHWNAWSFTGGGYHKPERFGKLTFAGNQSVSQETYRLSGRLVDAQGRSIADVPVRAFGRIERSNRQGRFSFEGVSAGEHGLSVISPLHRELHGKVVIKQRQEMVAPLVLTKRDPYRPDFKGPLGPEPVTWLAASLTEPPAMQTHPQAADRLTYLRCSAARGETAATGLSLFANVDLAQPTVQVTDLKNDRGGSLPTQARLHWVQRMLKPVHYQGPEDDALFVWRFLWPDPPQKVQANQLRLLSLCWHVPPQAQPGEYSGELRLVSKGQCIDTLPVTLTVGHFELIAPPERAGAFFNASRLRQAWQDTPQWYEVVFADMQAHGATTVCWWDGIRFNQDGIPSTEGARRSLALQIKYGMKPPYLVKFSLENLARRLGIAFKHKHAINVASLRQQEPAFRQAVQRGVKALRELEQEFGLERDELAIIWSDEVFLEGRLEPWLATAKIVREYTDNPIALTFDPRQEEKWAQVEPLVELPFFHGRNLDTWIDHDTRSYAVLQDRLGAQGDRALAYYNIIRADITPEYARIVNGLWLWRTPVNAQMHWTYFWGDQDALQGVYEGERLAPFFALAAPHPTRPFEMVSTLDWENLREGVTDHKYITTLEHAIQEAGNSQVETVTRARALLKSMWDVDPRVSKTAEVLSATDYDQRRRLMFDYIETLTTQP